MSQPVTRRRPRLSTVLLVALAALFGLAAAVPTALAQPARHATPADAVASAVAAATRHTGGTPGAKPTIVLVHGAWADSSGWNGEISRLQRAGYTVRAVPNPLRGLANDAGVVAGFLATVAGPVVLVGHSYGGAVISAAAAGNPNVKALVYVDAFVPDIGEAPVTLAGPDSALSADPTTVFDFAPYPGAPPGDADLYLKQTVFLQSFANDLPRSTALTLYAGQRPAAFSGLATPATAAAWKTIPSWYLLGTEDKVIPPAQQLFMARRAHSHIVRIRASHVSMISHPGATTDLILAAARTVR
ncbi:MAG TPA: alpha/beta hydrolase [Mycobacteriales bacterium]|nr:alpha/beta hydrolase [Mycobacteriales bacterium]